MKITNSLLLILALFLVSNTSLGQKKEMARKITEEVCKCQSDDLNNLSERKATYYLQKRIKNINRFHWYNYVDFSVSQDTLYFLTGVESETLNTYLTVWNRQDTISFLGKDYLKDPIVDKLIIKLIGNWNILALKEGSIGARIIGGFGTMGATRVIIKDKKLKVDCCKFEEFGTLED